MVPWAAAVVTDPPRMVALRKEEVAINQEDVVEAMEGVVATELPLRLTSDYRDYRRPVRKSPSLHGQKSTPNPKFLSTAEAYFVCHVTIELKV